MAQVQLALLCRRLQAALCRRSGVNPKKHSEIKAFPTTAMSQQRISFVAAVFLVVLAFAAAVFAQDEGYCQ